MSERKPDCKNHPTDIKGYKNKRDQLAKDLSNLRYSELADILEYLGMNLIEDARKDIEGDRKELGASLAMAGAGIKDAQTWIQRAWNISKPYMSDG